MELPPEMVDHILSFLPVSHVKYVMCPDLPQSTLHLRALDRYGDVSLFMLRSVREPVVAPKPVDEMVCTYDTTMAFIRLHEPWLTSEDRLNLKTSKLWHLPTGLNMYVWFLNQATRALAPIDLTRDVTPRRETRGGVKAYEARLDSV